jgi:drug/metabolite transporter (DMT)-like permease
VGIVVAVVGVTLASGPELSGGVSPRPVVLAGVAAVGFGFALFCIDRGARSSILMTLWGMRGVSFVVFGTLALAVRSRGGVVAREVPTLALIGCGDMVANLLFGIASSRGQVSVASVLASLYPVVTIVLARLLLKERLRRIQQVGAVLSLTGAAIIAL